MDKMKNFVILAELNGYSVPVQFVETASNWSQVVDKYPDAKFVRFA